MPQKKITRFESKLFVFLGARFGFFSSKRLTLDPPGQKEKFILPVPENSTVADLRVRPLFQSYLRYESLFWHSSVLYRRCDGCIGILDYACVAAPAHRADVVPRASAGAWEILNSREKKKEDVTG